MPEKNVIDLRIENAESIGWKFEKHSPGPQIFKVKIFPPGSNDYVVNCAAPPSFGDLNCAGVPHIGDYQDGLNVKNAPIRDAEVQKRPPGRPKKIKDDESDDTASADSET